MLMSRRGLLIGLGSLIAAPAIVRIESLMPVRAILEAEVSELHIRVALTQIAVAYMQDEQYYRPIFPRVPVEFEADLLTPR